MKRDLVPVGQSALAKRDLVHFSETGFTFVEMVCVFVVLAILIGAMLPRLGPTLNGLQAERAARQTSQLLRAARSLALLQGRPVDWVWSAEARSLHLEASGDEVPLEPRWTRPRALPEGAMLDVQRGGEPVTRISFFADGSSGGPDGTVLATQVQVWQREQPSYDVAVDGPTGRITLRQAGLPAG